jgi:hypothetical protein
MGPGGAPVHAERLALIINGLVGGRPLNELPTALREGPPVGYSSIAYDFHDDLILTRIIFWAELVEQELAL